MTMRPTVEGQPARADLVEAGPGDAEKIAGIFIEARKRMAYLPSSPYSDEQTTAFFCRLTEDPDNLVLTARVADGQIGGFGVFGERRLDHLYVQPAYQRQGLGTQLIQAAQARFRRLEGWVFEKNTDALELYERKGFEITEHTDGSRNEEGEPDVRIAWSRS